MLTQKSVQHIYDLVLAYTVFFFEKKKKPVGERLIKIYSTIYDFLNKEFYSWLGFY